LKELQAIHELNLQFLAVKFLCVSVLRTIKRFVGKWMRRINSF